MARNDAERRQPNGGNGTGIPMPFLDDMPDATRSFFDRSAEMQSEFLTLWSHRAQAWLNLPKQMMACKDPGDLSEAHGRFVTTMQRHYKEYFDTVLKDPLVQAEPARNGKSPSGPGNDGPKTQTQEHRKAA